MNAVGISAPVSAWSAGRRAECRKSSACAESDFLSRTGEDMDSELKIKELALE
jgi:hypothetical protein